MIIDSGYLGDLIIARIIGADKSNKEIDVRCELFRDDVYKCEFIGEYYTFHFLHKNELRTIFESLDMDVELKDKINITIPYDKVNKLYQEYREFHEKCKETKCYVTPDIPIEFKDGSFRNPIAFLKLYIKGKSFLPDKEKVFNIKLKELFKEYNLKVLVDRSFDTFFKEFGIYHATAMLTNMINNAFKHLGLTDVVETTDFKPQIYLFDVTIKKGKAKVFGEVIVDPVEEKIILKTDKGEKVFTKEDIERHEALKKIFDELVSKSIHIQAMHEAVKRLLTAENSIRIYYPETSIVDFFLRSIVKKEEVKSKDLDIYEAVGTIHTP